MAKLEIAFSDGSKITNEFEIDSIIHPPENTSFIQIRNNPITYINVNNIVYIKYVTDKEPKLTWL